MLKKKKNRWSPRWSWKEWFFNDGLAPKNILIWPPPPHQGLFCNNQSLKITSVRPDKIKIPLSRHEWNLTSPDSIGSWMFTLLTDCWSWDSHLIVWGMLVIYRFYFCIEYPQGPGGGRGCHFEAMKFEFHSKMHLILSNSVANLLRIVSQVSDLYLTGYNSQFISIKID